MKYFSPSQLESAFVNLKRIFVVDTVYLQGFTSCCGLLTLTWNSPSYSTCLNNNVDRSDLTSPLVPSRQGSLASRSLERIVLKIQSFLRSHQLVELSELKSRKHESLYHAIVFNMQVGLI